MDESDRQIILDNLDELMRKTQYDILLRECLDRKMLTKRMVELNQVVLLAFVLEKSNKYCSRIFHPMPDTLLSLGR
jgi:hypothetical protein